MACTTKGCRTSLPLLLGSSSELLPLPLSSEWCSGTMRPRLPGGACSGACCGSSSESVSLGGGPARSSMLRRCRFMLPCGCCRRTERWGWQQRQWRQLRRRRRSGRREKASRPRKKARTQLQNASAAQRRTAGAPARQSLSACSVHAPGRAAAGGKSNTGGQRVRRPAPTSKQAPAAGRWSGGEPSVQLRGAQEGRRMQEARTPTGRRLGGACMPMQPPPATAAAAAAAACAARPAKTMEPPPIPQVVRSCFCAIARLGQQVGPGCSSYRPCAVPPRTELACCQRCQTAAASVRACTDHTCHQQHQTEHMFCELVTRHLEMGAFQALRSECSCAWGVSEKGG